MVHLYKVAQPYIAYKDVFDFRRVYFVLRDFMEEESYRDKWGGEEYLENYYHEQRLAGGKKNIRFQWRSMNAPAKSEFFRYLIYVDVTIFNLVDVDIVKNNQKIKAQQGEIQIKIDGRLEVDYKKYFSEGSILHPFQRLIEKIVMKKDIEYHWLKVLDDVQKLELEIKQQLNLNNFLSEKRPFLEQL